MTKRKKNGTILLGYEVGTGEPVEIPLHHLIVTGATQLSGKTTTLEGLVQRSGLKAVAFRTKRGESGFEGSDLHEHPPYFKERADWQYVQSLLEATMRERMKFERSWIIRAAKGADTLRDVHANVTDALAKAKGLAESVYTNLKAYLEIVLPEIEAAPFSDKLHLHPGLNVIDLVGLRQEVQALVIASTLEAIHEGAKDTISVIPEAWKFLPQGRKTPVMLVVEAIAREGAAIGNYVWLDSQDITGVDKAVLKNFDVWVLGRQREMNEVARALKQIPLPTKARPKPEDVATLALGTFIACFSDQVRRVYAQPAWLPDDAAAKIARTGRVDAADLYRPETDTREEREPVHDTERAILEKMVKQLEAENKRLRQATGTEEKTAEPPAKTKKAPQVQVGPVEVDHVERDVEVRYSSETRTFNTTNWKGRILFTLITDLENEPSESKAIGAAMRERGWNCKQQTLAPEIGKMVKNGDLVSDDSKPAKYRLPGKLDVRIVEED